MPKIIKSGINYTPEAQQVQVDGVTIVDSEGVLSAVLPEVPEPDGATIILNSEGELEAVKQPQAQPDWFAEQDSEGYISNKPYVSWNGDDNYRSTVIGDIEHNSASGIYSVAEGKETIARGDQSHAEGYKTEASGAYSHAEGRETKAVGAYTHVEGWGTTAPNVMATHVQGRYNSNYDNSNFADIVGWGTSANRKNISALTTDGTLILAKTIKIGADQHSQGGYEALPIPDTFTPGTRYALAYDVDENTGEVAFKWVEFSLDEDPNKYKYNGSTTTNPGPFTIYDGTTDPTTSLGKPGDIYFKHS